MQKRRQNLIVVRAGNNSLHRAWVETAIERNYDVFVSYYGNVPNQYRKTADHYESVSGLKWPPIAKLCSGRTGIPFSYDACWFPDDDLLMDALTVNRMFNLFHERKLWLAQPALFPNGYINHKITAQITCAQLRFTNFVEIMCPIFSRHALRLLSPTFSSCIGGFGLDYVWSHLLGDPKDRIAILDETSVTHMRRPKTGPFYSQCRKLGIKPKSEVERVMKQFGLTKIPTANVYETIASTNHGYHGQSVET